MNDTAVHLPVMKEEAVSALEVTKGGIYIDATVGEGGHSQEILSRMQGKGLLVGIDRDSLVLDKARKRMISYGNLVRLVHGNFADLDSILDKEGVGCIKGIIFDLGISSFQLESRRGFSFQSDSPLDMRMDPSQDRDASFYINNLTLSEIVETLVQYGEERGARYIAEGIVETRQRKGISTTRDLVDIVARYLPRRYRRGYRHPATRTFQAFRIKVNDELNILEKAVCSAVSRLSSGGKICVLTYHSLEDRIIKNAYKKERENGLKIITKHPIKPSYEEVKRNPRARSAHLRIGIRS